MLIRKNILPDCSIIIYVLIFLFFLPLTGNSASQKDLFPAYSAIQDNIEFWEKIYATHSVNTAVLHDKNDLSIVYETITLLDRKLPGARRINRAYLKRVKKKYKEMLLNLAAGKSPTTAAEIRVLTKFAPPGNSKKLKRAAENLRFQTGLKERFRQGVVVSGAYIKKMKEIFRLYDLPEDLAYLPHVESSFNVKAYSKFGAAGVWQFTRSTGKYYMTIDYSLDERRDPIIATYAAAKYLKNSYKKLGTWPLAITSYNYGSAGMQRALQQEGSYVRIFRNYNKGHFKFASKNFYSEFVAARNIAKRLEKSNNIKMMAPKKSYSLKLRGYVHIDDLVKYFKLSTTELYELNLAWRPPVLKGEKLIPKGIQLKLPYDDKTIYLARTFPKSIYHKQQKRTNFYKVKRGDTAGKIARRHGVSLKLLRSANNLSKKSMVYIGQTLHIPDKSKKTTRRRSKTTHLATPKAQQTPVPVLSALHKTIPKKKKFPAKKEAAPNAQNLSIVSSTIKNGILHGNIIVQPEETLGIYAEWLKIDKNKILNLNKMAKANAIRPGQNLTLPFINTTQPLFEGQRLEFHKETEDDFFTSYKVTGFRNYRVANGDTLWDICQNKFELPLWLLKKYNSDLHFDRLQSRQHLKIPIIEAL